MDQSGCTFKSKLGKLRVAKGSLIMMKDVIKNGLYTLIGKTIISETSSIHIKMEDKVMLWHRRLGHVIQRGSPRALETRPTRGEKSGRTTIL